MRILTLCYEYPPIGGGGGRVAKVVAEGLAARGHEVRVQTAALGWRSVHERVNGVEVYRTASLRRRPDTCRVPEMGQYVMTSFWPTLRHCWSWKPDVIHAHFAVPTGLLAWMVHGLTKVPYVLTAHLGDVPGGVPEQTDRLFKRIGGVASRIWKGAAEATAVSSFVQELAEKAYGRSVRRIVNGVDLERRPAEEALTVGEPRELLFVGRFNRQKNAPLLAEALEWLREEAWRLTMIGDGPDLPKVKQRVEAAGLSGRVDFRGWCPVEEVQAAMAKSDVLCMPSSSEGMPVAAIEGLKYGLAIAASDIPGVRDVVISGVNGVTAPAGDMGAYMRALRELLGDRESLLAMKQASWGKAREFELEGIVGEYEEVLGEARRSL